MRVLDAPTVDSLLDVESVVEAIRDLFSIQGNALGYGRLDLVHPKGWLRSLPGYISPEGLLGFKVLHRTDGVGMRYTIYVHDLDSGVLAGIVDGLEITNLRTGAVSAVATEHMAVKDVQVAAVIGTGPVARGQLRALQVVRPATEIRVFARTRANRQRFIQEMEPLVDGRLVEARSVEEAVDGADLVTLATKATDPVLFEHHLGAGMHVNSVGPASRDRVEVDPAAFARFDRIVCDSVELVTDEAGDAHRAVGEGYLDTRGADDLSSLMDGSASGRSSDAEITLFKSVGTGVQDLMVAARLLEEAERLAVGHVVDDFVAVKPFAAPAGG